MLVGATVDEMQTGGGEGRRRRRRRLLPDTQRSTRAAAAHYSFYPQMSQFVSEFCVGPNLAPPPAVNSTLPQTFCRRRVAPSHHRAQLLPTPAQTSTCCAGACSAAAAVGGGSNAAAMCLFSACLRYTCATRCKPSNAAAAAPRPTPSVSPLHGCAAQFARAKVRNSPPLKPLLVFLFHAAC